MKIAVIGAAGKAGKLIAQEALGRGHEVTAIVKPGSEDRVPRGCAILAKSLFDLTAADLKDFAAVKTPETYLWDVRATNAGDGWQLEPVPKAAKKAFKALGLTPPDKIS